MIDSRTVRMILVTAISASLLAAGQPPAQAHHRPHEWCPPPEESRYCIKIQRSQGRRIFHVFRDGGRARRYRLCVTPPVGARTCKNFRYVTAMGVFTDRVVWRDHFPNKGSGPYTVVWRNLKGNRIGVPLGFHVR